MINNPPPNALSRRRFLQGAGVCMALPWLETPPFSNARSSAASSPVRMAFLYMPNGVFAPDWTPKGKDREFKLSPTLAPLEKLKSEILILSGLRNKNSLEGDGHYAKSAPFLTGCKIRRTGGRDIENGISVDQLAARERGSLTMLPSMELGTDGLWLAEDMGYTTLYGAHIAWRSASEPASKEIVPGLAFDRLFRDWRARTSPADKSVLDLVLAEARALRGKVSKYDGAKLDEYYTSVRELETRLERAAAGKPHAEIDASKRPADGIPADFNTHVDLMIDIIALAFQTDSTRILTFMMSNEVSGRNFSFLPDVKGAFHELSHHDNKKENQRQYALINKYYVSKFAALAEKLHSMREGECSVLDYSMILFGSGIRDGNAHEHNDLPIVVAGRAGGKWEAGRFLQFKNPTPLCNLYVSMLNNFGVATDTFSDSTGALIT
ncbi:MAG: DUF1552 domain-containing protein [Planctomycetes bacterium]|nr:DUF1552 domain-containing protein [Planctomycetota bacterium]